MKLPFDILLVVYLDYVYAIIYVVHSHLNPRTIVRQKLVEV